MLMLGIYVLKTLTILKARMDHNGFMKNSKTNTEFFSTLETVMELSQLMELSDGLRTSDGKSNNNGDHGSMKTKLLDTLKLEMD